MRAKKRGEEHEQQQIRYNTITKNREKSSQLGEYEERKGAEMKESEREK